MGNEAQCRVEVGGRSADAKALLETEELIVRGALRAKIPFAETRDVVAEDGVLRLRWNNDDVRIHLGKDAAKWAEKIRNPKSIFDKLGVKAGQKICIIGALDNDFVQQLEARGVDLSKKPRANNDILFFAANTRHDLARLETLKQSLAPHGALWIIRPKGSIAIAESDVMNGAKAAGLVDVKVARFSATHTAEKLVIPLPRR